MTDYIVMSFSNLKKSDVLGDIALQYISDIVKNYRLDEYGDVKGMSKYQEISKSARQKQLWAFKNHSLKLEAKEIARQKKEVQTDPYSSVKAYKKAFTPKYELYAKLKEKTASEKMQISVATDEMTLERALKPYETEYEELEIPKELLPSKKHQDIQNFFLQKNTKIF